MDAHAALLLKALVFCSWSWATGFETQPSSKILSFTFQNPEGDSQDYHDDLTKTAKLDKSYFSTKSSPNFMSARIAVGAV